MVKYAHIPKNNLIKHKGSRLIWDPNRSREAEDFIRKADFSWNIIASDLQKYQQEWERKHKEYHNTIEKKLLNTQEELWWVVAFDIHDTWVRLMDMNPRKDTFRKGSFPLITLGTRDGKSCNEEIVHYFSSRIEYYLWIEPLLNIPYKWWYVTQKHGELYRKERNTNRRNVIQVEIWRYLYMQESTQAVDIDRMKIIAAWLRMAITDTGNKFNKEYFRNL
jgi:N-formylglutamate amidohydrolase